MLRTSHDARGARGTPGHFLETKQELRIAQNANHAAAKSQRETELLISVAGKRLDIIYRRCTV